MKNVHLWTGPGSVQALRRGEHVLLVSGIALVAFGTISATLLALQAGQTELLRWAALPLLGFALAGFLLVASALLSRATVKARGRTAAPDAAVVDEKYANAA
jgi:hypothetical protein